MSGGTMHYVLVEGDRHRVWRRCRGARSLFGDLLWGPDRTVAFIQEQEGGAPDSWPESIRCEGVVLVDVRRRRMLVYTDRMDWTIPELRKWLKVLRARWKRWEVAWAPRGGYEVMDYLGLPYGTAAAPWPLRRQWAQAPAEADDLSIVASNLIAVRNGRLSFCGSWCCGLEEPLLAGPGALMAEQDEAVPFAVLEAVPWNGAYVDAEHRRLHWWAVDCRLGLGDLERAWPGWTLRDHGDAYEEVAALIGPELLIDVMA
jgi:hypothetical protein